MPTAIYKLIKVYFGQKFVMSEPCCAVGKVMRLNVLTFPYLGKGNDIFKELWAKIILCAYIPPECTLKKYTHPNFRAD